MKITGFEYFFLLCMLGPMLDCTFTVIANLSTSDDVSPIRMNLADEILNVVQIITQTAFYFLARSKVVAIGRDDVAKDKRNAFKVILLSLIYSNLTMWVLHLFVVANNVEKSFQTNFYKSWPFMYNFINPIVLMYRFNSVLMFTDIFLEMPRRQTTQHSQRQ